MRRGIRWRGFVVGVLAAGALVFVCLCGHAGQAGAERQRGAVRGGFYVHRALSDNEEEVFRWLTQTRFETDLVDAAYSLAPIGVGAWADAGRKMPAAEGVLCGLIRRRTVWFHVASVLRPLECIATSNSVPTQVSLYERDEGEHLYPLRSVEGRGVAAEWAVRRDKTFRTLNLRPPERIDPRDRRVAACLRQEGLKPESVLLRDAIGWPISLGPGCRDEAMPVVGQPWPLHDAVRAGDLGRAKVLLEQGIEPHLRDLDDETPLGIAAERGQLRVVELLLDGGAEAEDPGPIHRAAANGHADVVKLLLSRAPDMSGRDWWPGTLLQVAAWGGHLDVMELLLSTGVNIDGRDAQGFAPLVWAAWAGKRESVEFLLERGADVNAKSRDMYGADHTPLCFALCRGHRDVFEPLLGRGATCTDGLLRHELDRADFLFMQAPPAVQRAAGEGRPQAAQYLLGHGGSKETVLWWGAHEGYGEVVKEVATRPDGFDDYQWQEALCVAIDAGHLEIVRLLVEQGADVNVGENEAFIAFHRRQGTKFHPDLELGPEDAWARGSRLGGYITDGTALHWAAARGREDIMEFLLASGADVNAAEDSGTPLHWAVDAGEAGAVKLLLAHGANPNVARKGGATALHTAALFNESDVAEALLAAGADVHAKDLADQRPLHRAATFADARFVQLLLEHGAEVNARGFNDEVPLHQAAMTGDKDVVQVLLDRGADVTARDIVDRTPLHVATEGGHTDAALLLITHGSDVSAVDKDGETPLHLAARAGDEEVVRRLLERQAPLNVKDALGLTPLHWAVRKEHYGVAELLVAGGARHDVHTAAGMGDLEAARALLAADRALAGAELGRLGTPLHWAVLGGHPDMVALLLESGAPPNAKDGAGDTALGLATWRGDRESVSLLLSHGADPNARGEGGITALHIAARLGYADMVELLLSHGADMDLGDREGDAALHEAARANSLRVAELLLKAGADPNLTPKYWPWSFGAEGGKPLARALYEQSRMAELLRQHGATE